MIDLTDAEWNEFYGLTFDEDGEDWLPLGYQPDFTKFVAVPHIDQDDCEGLWCIAPKVFWENNACIPDWESGFKIPGFRECMEHTFEPSEGVEGIEASALRLLGFEVIEDPDWYFESKKQ